MKEYPYRKVRWRSAVHRPVALDLSADIVLYSGEEFEVAS
jgi:hypothetical protein